MHVPNNIIIITLRWTVAEGQKHHPKRQALSEHTENMAPPPSQAGKFKPRKPANMINVGGAETTSATPDVTGSSASIPGRGRDPAIGGRAVGGRGRRGGGRGVGGGRVGARAPIPQGQAFFTAQPAPISVSSRQRQSGSTAGSTAPPSSQQLQQDDSAKQHRITASNRSDRESTEEEIVGVLECAVGSAQPLVVKSEADGKKSRRDPAMTDLERALMGGEDTAHSGYAQGNAGYFYESDSSQEDEQDLSSNLVQRNDANPLTHHQLPLTLPFAPKRPESSFLRTHPPRNPNLSPMDESRSNLPLLDDTDAWFLVQLPTRLPPVKQQADVKQENDIKILQEDTSGVATSALQVNAFDNVLAGAMPGRIGTLKIFASGRSILVLNEGDGNPVVSFVQIIARSTNYLF